MPTKTTKKRAAKAKRQGKAPSTQAGAFVREKVRKMKRGQGNAKSRKQAIAIGLSEARRAGVKVPKKKGSASRSKTGSKAGGKSKSSSSRSTTRKSSSKKK